MIKNINIPEPKVESLVSDSSLNGAGVAMFDSNGTLTVALSDKRIKTDIREVTVQEAIETLEGLNPVAFKYTEDSGLNNSYFNYGLIAQEVKNDILVDTGKHGFMSVSYHEIVPLLITAFKHLQSSRKDEVLMRRFKELKAGYKDEIERINSVLEVHHKVVKSLEEQIFNQVEVLNKVKKELEDKITMWVNAIDGQMKNSRELSDRNLELIQRDIKSSAQMINAVMSDVVKLEGKVQELSKKKAAKIDVAEDENVARMEPQDKILYAIMGALIIAMSVLVAFQIFTK